MTGYQEIITDPSYRGQGVLFTVAHIGNVGINREDDESAAPQVSAVVTRSLSPAVSDWRPGRPALCRGGDPPTDRRRRAQLRHLPGAPTDRPALGGTTSRLKFGHHGGNHPVQDLRTGAVAITAQNHNYQVDTASLDPAEVEITHLSLNDGSLEGMRLRHKPVFCVQYHPEAAPGPHDAHDLFGEFLRLIRM
jgi:carbamoylphosphate synthase small subunit